MSVLKASQPLAEFKIEVSSLTCFVRTVSTVKRVGTASCLRETDRAVEFSVMRVDGVWSTVGV